MAGGERLEILSARRRAFVQDRHRRAGGARRIGRSQTGRTRADHKDSATLRPGSRLRRWGAARFHRLVAGRHLHARLHACETRPLARPAVDGYTAFEAGAHAAIQPATTAHGRGAQRLHPCRGKRGCDGLACERGDRPSIDEDFDRRGGFLDALADQPQRRGHGIHGDRRIHRDRMYPSSGFARPSSMAR